MAGLDNRLGGQEGDQGRHQVQEGRLVGHQGLDVALRLELGQCDLLVTHSDKLLFMNPIPAEGTLNV